jgi:mRNA interferase MazF
MLEPSRGEIWLANLNPVKGHEQAGIRPGLIFSVDQFNASAADLVIIIPITTKAKNIPFHVAVVPPEGDLKETSFIKCEDIRSISKERLTQRLGAVSALTLTAVEDRIRILLGL